MSRRLIFFLYRALLAVTFPLFLVYVVYRILRQHEYAHHLAERFGAVPRTLVPTVPGAIWLHAVSVGEVLSSLELVRRLRADLPGVPLYVSTTTLAGRRVADEKIAPLVDGVLYAPFDFVFAVRRRMRALRPALVVVLETEIWPNVFQEVRRFGASLVVVNGRISDKALPSYRRMTWFFRQVLPLASRILVQSEEDRERYVKLGAGAGQVCVAGNLKFDFEPASAAPPEAIRGLLERSETSEVWIAASTVGPEISGDPDEDDAVLDAFRRLAPDHPRLAVLVAPRKPERFEVVANKLSASGVPFLRRSQLTPESRLPLPGILLVDSLGELSSLFALADVVFMGGTLPHRGGHNILEPAIHGCPVIAGPHLENFAAIAVAFRRHSALAEIQSSDQLARTVHRLLRNRQAAQELGAQGRAVAQEQRGAVGRAVTEICRWHERSFPRRFPPAVARQILNAFASAWGIGVERRRKAHSARARKLETPVISVGGIAVGGTGKTPLVNWIAGRLADQGKRVAILTRGYRRSESGPVILLPGESAPVSSTGDEAQLLLRSGRAALGIAAERSTAGLMLEQRFHPDVFLLDDGFQHWRLARKLDIVAIDTLDPVAGGALLPAGRLRELPEALARAGIIVLQRADFRREYRGVIEIVRRYNHSAPIFRSRVEPRSWTHLGTGERFPAQYFAAARVSAFCGLAQPASFWCTLQELGIVPELRIAFPDHHRYRAADLSRFAPGSILLTTEKDRMNLVDVPLTCEVYSLNIEICMERESEFLDLLLGAISMPSSASSSRL